MQTITIWKSRTKTFNADDADTLYVLDKDASILTMDPIGIGALTAVNNRDFLIRGEIQATSGYGIALIGKSNDITVAKSGAVLGDIGITSAGDDLSIANGGLISGRFGLQFTGDNNRVFNTGTISGQAVGIDAGYHTTTIVNDGLISSSKTGISSLIFAGETLRIVNDGSINAAEYGIACGNLTGGRTVIINHGELSGGFWAITGGFNQSSEIVINRGTITGSIGLGAGNDRYDGRGGHATYVQGDAGDDTYIIDDALITLNESAAAGTDLVRSSVSWTLGANFENLRLSGTDSIVGKGNSSMNRLTGNAGQNSLYGYDNSDMLNGGKGDDFLFGGAGSDIFIFTNASGQDVIEDFQNGIDMIDLTARKGIDGFDDIQSIMVQNAGNVELHFANGDVLVVRNITIANLGIDDFAF